MLGVPPRGVARGGLCVCVMHIEQISQSCLLSRLALWVVTSRELPVFVPAERTAVAQPKSKPVLQYIGYTKYAGEKRTPPSRKNDRATGKLKEKSNTACHRTNSARPQSLLSFSLFIICSFGIVEQDILFPCFEFHFDHIWIVIFLGCWSTQDIFRQQLIDLQLGFYFVHLWIDHGHQPLVWRLQLVSIGE